MKAALVLVVLGLVAQVQGGDKLKKKILKNIHQYNFACKCWGETNMHGIIKQAEEAKAHCMQEESSVDLGIFAHQQINPFSPVPARSATAFNLLRQFTDTDHSKLQSLWRNKRQAATKGTGLLDVDEDDLYEFLQDFQIYKSEMVDNMGNLTCVLQQMDILTDDLKINIDYYTSFLADADKEGFDFNVEGSAVADPLWRKKMSDGYEDCYKIAESWPQASLNRNPITKVAGRNIVFFKCTKKMEKKLCAEAQVLEWLETLYGSDPNEDLSEWGLPDDKYDAAAISMYVQYESLNKQEKFVDDFFWGEDDSM